MQRIDVVAAVIIRDGRILLTQRAPTGSFQWLFECPGGKVEDGEGFDTALERELDEELGVVARVQSEGPYPFRFVDLDPPVCKAPRRIHFLRAEIVAGIPLPRVAVDMGWFTPNAIAGLRMTPANEARREELVKLLRGEST